MCEDYGISMKIKDIPIDRKYLKDDIQSIKDIIFTWQTKTAPIVNDIDDINGKISDISITISQHGLDMNRRLDELRWWTNQHPRYRPDNMDEIIYCWNENNCGDVCEHFSEDIDRVKKEIQNAEKMGSECGDKLKDVTKNLNDIKKTIVENIAIINGLIKEQTETTVSDFVGYELESKNIKQTLLQLKTTIDTHIQNIKNMVIFSKNTIAIIKSKYAEGLAVKFRERMEAGNKHKKPKSKQKPDSERILTKIRRFFISIPPPLAFVGFFVGLMMFNLAFLVTCMVIKENM